MKQYNYRIVYTNGASTELLGCPEQVDFNAFGHHAMVCLTHDRTDPKIASRTLVNPDHVMHIDEWVTEKE